MNGHVGATLPLRVVPEPDEPLLGLMVRLAERNGFASPSWLAREAGMPFAAIEIAASSPWELAGLSALSGMLIDELRGRAYWPIGSTYRRTFFDHQIRREFFAIRVRRICPRCLSESGYHRAAWDIAPLTVCPVHKLRLVTRCPRCLRRLNWNFGGIVRCRCGQDLRAVEAETVPEADVQGAAYLLGVLGPTRTEKAKLGASSILGELGADEAISLLLHLGWAATGLRLRPRPSKLAAVQNEMHIWLTRGLRAIGDCPTSFERYLEELRAQAGERPGRYGAAKEIGWIAEWVYDDRETEKVRNLVRRGLRFRSDELMTARRRFVEECAPDGSRLLRVSDVARSLGLPTTRVRRVFESYGLLDNPDSTFDCLVSSDPNLIHMARDELEELVDRAGLSRLLCCSGWLASNAEHAGLFRRATGLAADLFARDAWRRADIANTLSWLEHRASGARPPRRPIPLTKALGELPRRQIGRARGLLLHRRAGLALDTRVVGLPRIIVDEAALH